MIWTIRKKQIFISLAFIGLFIVTTIFLTAQYYYWKLSGRVIPRNFWPTLLMDICSIILLSITLIDRKQIRFLQAFLFCIFGCMSFITDTPFTFWGWGMILAGVMLAQVYGYWDDNFRRRAILWGIIILSSTAISGVVHNDLFNTMGSVLIYMTFSLGFLTFLYKDKVDEMLRLKQNYRKLSDELVIRSNEIQDLEEKLDQIINEKEKLLAKAIIKDKQLLLDEGKDAIRNKLAAIKGMDRLTPTDIEIILSFYISRGNKTNQELAFDVGRNEDFIKNRFRVIYRTLPGVDCRSALLAYVEDGIRA